MSNSYKKNPFIGICGNSEKKDKRAFNRGFRTSTKSIINKKNLDYLPERKNPKNGGNWNFFKDSKIRFCPIKYPDLLRK